MKPAGWEKIYESGALSGSSKERVRILKIIQEFSDDAGERAIQLMKESSAFREGTRNQIELSSLSEIAVYEQRAYIKVMQKINELVE